MQTDTSPAQDEHPIAERDNSNSEREDDTSQEEGAAERDNSDTEDETAEREQEEEEKEEAAEQPEIIKQILKKVKSGEANADGVHSATVAEAKADWCAVGPPGSFLKANPTLQRDETVAGRSVFDDLRTSLYTYFRAEDKPDNQFAITVVAWGYILDNKLYEDEERFPREFEWHGIRKKWTAKQSFYYKLGLGPGGRVDSRGSK